MTHVLCLFRHGIAEERTPDRNDEDRALTERGARRTRLAAMGLQALGVEPDVVLSSPLRRARETAELIAHALARESVLRVYAPLGPGSSPSDVLRGLRAHRQASTILLVGHEPDLGMLLSGLLTGRADGVGFSFKKAGAAAVAVDSLPPKHDAELLWFMGSRELRRLARSS